MKKLLLSVCILATLVGCKPGQEKNTEAFQLPEVADIAMYQVNPRVFAPSNSLNAVAARIDSIRDLGVNMMWVMPIYPIGLEKGKNSPYCISDYKAIAPEFGTIDDFKHLVQVCHEHQMGIILDWVANHTAWDHPWVKEHPDWYTRDEKADTIICPSFGDCVPSSVGDQEFGKLLPQLIDGTLTPEAFCAELTAAAEETRLN